MLCEIFGLEPKSQWWEALRISFLPKIPNKITLFNQTEWKQVENAFETGQENQSDKYFAAWQLLLDVWLFVLEYYESPEQTIFNHLAELTKDSDFPALRIAHCIRDLAYGNDSRKEELVLMVKSEEPEYKHIFETCYWREN